ncbi:aurora kinase A- and ninein-interacting protein isoform X2 [Carettochelys insculpta]
MKRLRKRSAAEHHETCGIWLDTAKLKKCNVQTLVFKPASYVPNPLLERNCNSHISVNLTSTRISEPHTKQTTISSFFRIQPAGENDDNIKPYPFMSNNTHKGKCSDSLAPSSAKNCRAAKLKEVQAPTLNPQETNIQECSHTLEQNTQDLNTSLLNYTLPQVQSNSRHEYTALVRTSAGETENYLPINFTQDSEGNRVLAHKNSADSFTGSVSVANGISSQERENSWIGEKEGHLCSQRERTRVGLKPKHLMTQGKRRCKKLSCDKKSFTDLSDIENINPAAKVNEDQQTNCPLHQWRTPKAELLKDSQNVSGSWTKNYYTTAGSADEQGDSKSTPTTQLFTQDSEGYRVISHRHFHESIRSPLQMKHLQDKTNSVHDMTSTLLADCFNGYSSGIWDRTPVASTAMNLGEPDSSCDLLFTEDSEGNRMIKH